ncbi:fatty acyl-CoA reductase 1-like isoform X2 [Manduca sexta]|uniref:fatty acyl-CoA reductase 1-like isoform X2 n=1 Tax=Manduca sexta TaxID=7130 RepID=UPI001183C61E|nr:fatty acyl-CoA reductase 1-like isoform X2 [Manduca sexta]
MTQEFQNGSYQSVSDFYSGRSVFITGATGFLGKAYVEKLAYECREIDKIYILIRHKKAVNLEQRIQNYLDQPEERPEVIQKIIPILGDITAPKLGLKAEDEQTLIDKVSVVIHSAAVVKFNQALKDAINANVEGTRKVLSLAKLMKNVCTFVYISTAYSNCQEYVVEEVLYPPPADLEEAKKFAMKHYILGDDDKELIKNHPNTYTFSKALAEQVVAENRGDLPTIIIRPSIVSASEREPVKGWVDNLTAATGVITSLVKGWIHVIEASGDVVLDIIPLDYVVNLTIVAASRSSLVPGLRVYHSCSSTTNPITLKNIYTHIKEFTSQNNNNASHHVSMFFIKNKALVSGLTCLMQISPAFMADMWLRCKGKQPKYLKLQSKVLQGRNMLEFFSTRSWQIHSEGACSLYSSLSPEDRKAFRCDTTHIEWREYIFHYLVGIERYLARKS